MYSYRLQALDSQPENARWKILARENSKVEAIREVRTLTGAGLKEAKDFVEAYLSRPKAPASMPSAPMVTTRNYAIPGGTLTVVDNGTFASVQYTRTVALNVPSRDVVQHLLDLATTLKE